MELHYLMSWTTVLKVTPFSVSLSVREVSAKAYPEAEMFSWRMTPLSLTWAVHSASVRKSVLLLEDHEAALDQALGGGSVANVFTTHGGNHSFCRLRRLLHSNPAAEVLSSRS